MSVETVQDITTVWQEVRQWSARQRLVLAARILQSLQEETQAISVSDTRRESLRSLIGIWKTENPPSDQDVQRILEEERAKKHS